MMALRAFATAVVLAGALLLNGCGRDDEAQAPHPNPQFGSFRWSSFPVNLEVEPSFTTGAKKSDLRAAMGFWEKHAGKKLFQISGEWNGPGLPLSGAPDSPDSIFTNAIVFAQALSPEANIAGLTSLRVTGSTIDGAVILLDDKVGLCSGLCESDSDETSLRRLLAHELGHFLGLGHSADRESIMYPQIQPGGSLRDRTIDEAELHRLTD